MTQKELELAQKPWISSSILVKCKQKNSLLKQIAKTTNTDLLEDLRTDYKSIRNEITADKRRGKREYYNSYFESNKHKASEIWKGIRQLVSVNNKPKSSNIKLFDSDGTLINDETKISNIFNNHFSTIGSQVGSKIPPGRGSYEDYLNKRDDNNRQFLNPPQSFFLTPSSPNEVEQSIGLLDTKKSTGPISVPVFIIKKYKDFFSIWLS